MKMRACWLIGAAVVVAGCSGGSSSSGQSSRAGSSGSSDKAAPPIPKDGSVVQLTLHKVIDTEGTGKLACTYLLPDGYEAKDTLKWNTVAYLTPVVGISTIKSNDGQIVLESMSGLQLNFGHSPAGSFGQDPPKDLRAFLLHSWKKEHPGLRFKVVSSTQSPVPEATQRMSGSIMYANRAVVELQYEKDGSVFHVKLNVRIDVMSTVPSRTAIGGVIYEGCWVIGNAYSVTAVESRFAEAMKTFGIIMSSVRMDPHFYNRVAQAREIIQRNTYAGIRRAGEVSRIISQTNDQMIASIDRSFHESQAATEKEVTGFDDYIRGIDRYNEGEGGEVSLPSGYAHAWSDGFGKYIVSDDHLYNPNVGGPNGTWHEMDKKP